MTKRDNINYLILTAMGATGFGIIILQWISQGVIVLSK